MTGQSDTPSRQLILMAHNSGYRAKTYLPSSGAASAVSSLKGMGFDTLLYHSSLKGVTADWDRSQLGTRLLYTALTPQGIGNDKFKVLMWIANHPELWREAVELWTEIRQYYLSGQKVPTYLNELDNRMDERIIGEGDVYFVHFLYRHFLDTIDD